MVFHVFSVLLLVFSFGFSIFCCYCWYFQLFSVFFWYFLVSFVVTISIVSVNFVAVSVCFVLLVNYLKTPIISASCGKVEYVKWVREKERRHGVHQGKRWESFIKFFAINFNNRFFVFRASATWNSPVITSLSYNCLLPIASN